jgi:uncharacterized protein YdeI (BOF family)
MNMKRTLIAALLAMFATTVLAASSQYSNEAGEQDLHTPIASSDQYRNEAGEQDVHTSIADAGDKGAQDQNFPQVG